MLLDFSELNRYFFNISNIFASRQIISGKTNFTMSAPRHTDAFLFFSNTFGVCYQNNLPPLYIPHGSLVYMPRGSQYIWENSPSGNDNFQENLLFEFTLSYIDIHRGDAPKKAFMYTQDSGDHIFFSKNVMVVTTRHSSLYRNLFLSLIDTFNTEHSLPLSVYTAAYEIFNTIASNCLIEKKSYSNISIIENSIKALEGYSSPSKSIKDIAASHNISISHYERLFRNYTGISPVEYRNIHKINCIKSFLHDAKITLDEISEKMGYCDSSYLCRFFKRQTGMTPKEYRNIYISQTMNSQLKG